MAKRAVHAVNKPQNILYLNVIYLQEKELDLSMLMRLKRGGVRVQPSLLVTKRSATNKASLLLN